jgi:hypothetical protein
MPFLQQTSDLVGYARHCQIFKKIIYDCKKFYRSDPRSFPGIQKSKTNRINIKTETESGKRRQPEVENTSFFLTGNDLNLWSTKR